MQTPNRVIALGFFDGAHIGHGALFTKTTELAAETGATASVMSFDAPPVKAVALINSPHDRADIIRRQYGIEDIIFLHFDDTLRTMPWETFIEWLRDDFGAVHLVAGYDFRFGYRGEGSAALLRLKCAELGLGCTVVGKVEVDGTPVSSTGIRALLEAGDIEGANRLLGHPYFVSDTVRSGYRVGHKLDAPTINMRFEPGVLVPRRGVYVTKAYLPDSGEGYGAVTNIGVRPSVGGTDDVTVESHLLGFDGNLYGKRVRVDFLRFLRPEIKFDTLDGLKAQIAADGAAASAYFSQKAE